MEIEILTNKTLIIYIKTISNIVNNINNDGIK